MTADIAKKIDVEVGAQRLPEALALAQYWTSEEPGNANAWSKLGMVCQLTQSLPEALAAMAQAVSLRPDYPPYLFELGYVEYRVGKLEAAVQAFERCKQVSLDIDDDYYLDAARIAQAQCLLQAGRAHEAAEAIADAADESATWLSGRQTAAEVSVRIQRQLNNAPARRRIL